MGFPFHVYKPLFSEMNYIIQYNYPFCLLYLATIADLLDLIYLCPKNIAMAYKDIDIKSFVMQWNKIHDRTMKLLKETEAEEPMYVLFSIENKTEEEDVSLNFMANVMNKDPQYLQSVLKAVNKKPHLSVVKGENGAMLMLCLMPLAQVSIHQGTCIRYA